MTPRRSVLETISSSGAKVRASPVGATGRPALREAGRSWTSSKGVLRPCGTVSSPLPSAGRRADRVGRHGSRGRRRATGRRRAGRWRGTGQTRTPWQDVEQSVDHTVRRPEKTALRTRRSPPGPVRTSPEPPAPAEPSLPEPPPEEPPPVPPPPGLTPVPPVPAPPGVLLPGAVPPVAP